MKSLFGILCASILAISIPQAAASPADSANILEQPDVILLSAKIENAIAELPEARTEETIQNAAFFVLATQNSAIDIKAAAIENVIIHARADGNKDVADALENIDLGADENVKVRGVVPEEAAADKQVTTASFRAPPSSVSKGGSDY